MMKQLCALCILISTGLFSMTSAATVIPANSPHIQYLGRWDMTDPLHPKHSWPGVSIVAAFTGTSIGVRMTDSINYYNVTIDDSLHSVFHGTKSGEADYALAENLPAGNHLLRLSLRNIAFDVVFSVGGILLDDGATLLDPPLLPSRKIEFVGDSFTAAESDEAPIGSSLKWEDRFPVTNFDRGFAATIARHYNAQCHATCRSGGGLFSDWQGKTDMTIPDLFDRTLMERKEPTWDFKQWVPDLVVVALGLNDHSGLKGKDGVVPDAKSAMFRKAYHEFLARLRSVYPDVKIMAVAAPVEWIRANVEQVVKEERASGHKDIWYTYYDEFPELYVSSGHPTAKTHALMAEEIIKAIDQAGIFANQK
jgi:hypothetical protein